MTITGHQASMSFRLTCSILFMDVILIIIVLPQLHLSKYGGVENLYFSDIRGSADEIEAFAFDGNRSFSNLRSYTLTTMCMRRRERYYANSCSSFDPSEIILVKCMDTGMGIFILDRL